MLDGTDLPHILASITPFTRPCADAVTHLLPLLLSPISVDPLLLICAQATDEFLRERRAAIEHAAEMLQRGAQREEVLALLEYLAQHDEYVTIREQAQAALKATQPRPAPTLDFGDPDAIFSATCKKCGHANYFNKHRVCRAGGTIKRIIHNRADGERDELYLKCEKCGAELIAEVDCRGYK